MSTSDHGAAAKFTAKCTLFRSWINSTLVGFASIEIAEIGLAIHHIAIHEKGSARWAQLPARPPVRDGALVKNERVQYVPRLDFGSRPMRDAFSAAATKAVLEHAPDAFDRGHQALQKAKEA
jgi:hypothetical protein